MSIAIKCVITIEQQAYEGGLTEGVVFIEEARVASTGAFADLPKAILNDMVKSVSTRAVNGVKGKLDIIKGRE